MDHPGLFGISTLPLEVLSVIIDNDWRVYKLLALSLPNFGRSTLATQGKWRSLFSTTVVEKDKTYKLLAGKLHCDDGPAEFNDFEQKWYQYGLEHRDGDLPSCIERDPGREGNNWQEYRRRGVLHRDGDQPARIHHHFGSTTFSWYQNGKLHRDGDKPAEISGNMMQWMQHGVLHRDGDNPAFIMGDIKRWYKHGEFHRDGDQPAITYGDKKLYFVNGVQRWYPVGKEPPVCEILEQPETVNLAADPCLNIPGDSL